MVCWKNPPGTSIFQNPSLHHFFFMVGFSTMIFHINPSHDLPFKPSIFWGFPGSPCLIPGESWIPLRAWRAAWLLASRRFWNAGITKVQEAA
jgi:hypothetical protein